LSNYIFLPRSFYEIALSSCAWATTQNNHNRCPRFQPRREKRPYAKKQQHEGSSFTLFLGEDRSGHPELQAC
jgi:hypothetical protein